MKRVVTLFLAMAMVLSLGTCVAFADNEELYAVEGEELALFDQDDIKLTWSGESEVISDMLQLPVVIENGTDATLHLVYTGTVNGWSIGNSVVGGNTPQPNSKTKCYLWFKMDDVEIDAFADLEEMHLIFTVKDADEGTLINDSIDVNIRFNEGAPAEATAEEPATEELTTEEPKTEEPTAEVAEAEPSEGDVYSREVTLPAKEYATLDVGNSGSEVQTLQQALIDKGFLDGSADGVYGNGTAGAVKAFQETAGLEATGVADARTRRALYGESDEGRTVTLTLTGTWQTDHMRMEGLVVDQSAVSQSDPDLALLYLFYTVTAGEDGLAVNSGDTGVVIDGGTYTCTRVPNSSFYLPNYYCGEDMKDVAAGHDQKVMESAWVSRRALEAGGDITLIGTDAPDGENIRLEASDVLWLDSVREVAQVMDMDGYQDVTRNTLAIGDTITTDEYEFTLNNVELTYELLPPNTSGLYYSYTAPKGKVYLHIDASVKNLMKRDLRIDELFSPGVTYSEGYMYTGFVVVNDGDNHFNWVSSYVAATPLETCHAHGLVECPVEVDQNDDYLCATVKLSDGEIYKYIVRAGDGF